MIIQNFQKHWGHIAIMEKNMETTIEGLGFKV